MKLKKVFILMANPDSGSLSASIAGAYEEGALEAGHEVRRMNIGDMHFDPILHKGYKVIQQLEPDLHTFQSNVRWADHVVVVYPNWWCTMPALLKGLIDRTWLPGFAFRMRKNGLGWEQLLKGKSARIVMLTQSNPWLIWWFFGDYRNELRRATLGFAGLAPIHTTILSNAERASQATYTRWHLRLRALGRKAK